MSKHVPAIHTHLRPTPRELCWFAHIDRHGPQSSEFLVELTKDTHRCKDTALRRLQALRETGYLFLPPQQRQIAKADFNPYVYDLTPTGFEYLSFEQELERHARPTGHWWHGFWVASLSSAIEIVSTRAGHKFIPAARILSIKDVPPGIPTSNGMVIPDQLFAIKTTEGYRAYALEVDRGTEPVRSSAARKSLLRSVAQYQEILDEKLHQRHYGLKCNLLVLWVFGRKARQQQWLELLSEDNSPQNSAVCVAQYPRWQAVRDTVSAPPLYI